jgi:hypothetical protein
MCDNGDDLHEVTRDAFQTPMSKEDHIMCTEIPEMAMHAWFGKRPLNSILCQELNVLSPF